MAKLIKVKFLRPHQGKRPGETLDVTFRQAKFWSESGFVVIVPDKPPVERAVLNPKTIETRNAPAAKRPKTKVVKKRPSKKRTVKKKRQVKKR